MTDYFVDQTDGVDGGAGTSELTPWKTVAKVNGETFSAGDRIKWKNGELWREEVVVPNSGSSGSPITLEDYGIGAKAAFSGADIITTWTPHLVNLVTNGDFVDWADATVPDGWTKEGTHNGSNYVEEVPADKLHIVSSGTHTGINNGSIAVSLNWYHYSVKVDTATSGSFRIKLAGNKIYFSTAATHTGMFQCGDGDNRFMILNDGAADFVVDEVILSEPYWQATVTTEPTAVWFDGTFGDKKTSVANLVNEFDWYWDSNVLYVYAITDPDARYTAIEATSRTSCIDGNDKSYITVDALELTKAKKAGIHISSTNAVRASDWIVKNSTISNQDLMGVYIGDDAADILTANDVTIQDSIISLWFRSVQGAAAPGTIVAPAIYQIEGDGSGGDNLTISGMLFTGDMGLDANNDRNAIQIETGNNLLIESGEIDQAEHGIYIIGDAAANGSAETFTIRYMLIHDTSDDFIWIKNPDTGAVDCAIYYNVMYNGGDNGMQFQSSSVSYGSTYNNIIFDTENAAVLFIFGLVATNFKNNIIMNYGSGENGGGNNCAIFLSTGTTTYGAGSSFDYNLYYKSGNSTPFYETTLGARTLAQWQSDMGDDANTLNVDPLFTDTASANFTLQSASPCRDAGVNVSLTRDFAGRSVGSPPNMGAYEPSAYSIAQPAGRTIARKIAFNLTDIRGDF